MKRTVIIGDVHGCLDELKRLLDVVDYDKVKDRLIFLGDLVDRGPDSPGCVKLVRQLGVECVVGNHDNKYVRYYKHELRSKEDSSYKNPMFFHENQKKIYNSLDKDDLSWLTALPYKIYIKEHNMILMHAGVLGKYHPLHQHERVYIYCRYVDKKTGGMVRLNPDHSQPENSVFWTANYDHEINIVYGHQVVDLQNPRILTNSYGAKTYGIDTGACYGGHLTALLVSPDGNVDYKQVKSTFKYKDFILNK